MSELPSTQPQLPGKLMLGIALGQGIALFLLWRMLEHEAWPSQIPAINFPLWTLVLVAPTMLLLCLEQRNLPRSLKAVGLFSGTLALIAVYMGWQASPQGEFPIVSLLLVYVLTTLIACFKGLMYCQPWIAKSPADYATLFTYSWRNFLVVALATLLALGVALILYLWATLFAAIGIDFFKQLFGNDWFLFPVLASAFGMGALIFRRLVKVIDSITSLLEGLMRLLLPLLATVLLIFLGALPFTTLQPLWETGSGTALLLWLNAFALFFVNAVYQTGQGSPYPPWVHRGLSASIALLPIISGLALYGLYLRVDEYGWTVQRCWAFTVFAILALFSVGYAWYILRRRWQWPRYLGRVNKAMGWVVLVLMLLVNSPVLDFRSIALASQWQRVESGEVALHDFDFNYAQRQLARPGHQKMQALVREYENSDPELIRIIKATEQRRLNSDQSFDTLWANLSYRPEPFDPPPGLREAASMSVFGRIPERHNNTMLVRVDLDADGAFEYVLISQHRNNDDLVEAELLYREGDAWQRRPLVARDRPDDIDIFETLRGSEIEAVPPRFKNLKLGDLVFREAY